MPRIIGRVLVTETHCGVPNLVAVVFQSDAKAAQGQRSPAKRGPRASNALLGLRHRLGSAWTDAAGAFEITIDDALLRRGRGAQTVGTVVAVFAPDDVGADTDPTAALAADRLLYLSPSVRYLVGASDAYVIRVAQATLTQCRIPIVAPSDARPVSRAAFRESRTAQLREEHARTMRFRQYGKQMVEHLSGLPAHRATATTHENDLLIARRADLVSKLPTLQVAAVVQGLQRMATAVHRPTLRLRLTANDLADLGLRHEHGTISGTATSAALASKTRALIKGVDLVRVRGLRTPSPDALERRYLQPSAKPAAPARLPSAGAAPPTPVAPPAAPRKKRRGAATKHRK